VVVLKPDEVAVARAEQQARLARPVGVGAERKPRQAVAVVAEVSRI
jgi:hypothetical protein